MNTEQREWMEAVSPLSYANPFLPERVELERAVLGSEFLEGEPVWSYRAGGSACRASTSRRLMARLEPFLEQLCGKLRSGAMASEHDLALYEDAVLHLLYQRSYTGFYEGGFGAAGTQAGGRWRFYSEFLADWRHFFAHRRYSLSERA